jgi:hypothetical protein
LGEGAVAEAEIVDGDLEADLFELPDGRQGLFGDAALSRIGDLQGQVPFFQTR